MNFWETVRMGVQGITSNKLRSSLTMSGILIGVAAVIVLIAIGNGASVAVTSSIESLGTNVLTVRHGTFGAESAGRTQFSDLTIDDALALTDPILAPDIQSSTPIVSADASCIFNGSSYDTTVTGSWPTYFETTNSDIASGIPLTNDDVENGRRSIVLGQTVIDELLGDSEPVGQVITCGGVPFTVIGTIADKGSSGFTDADDVAVAPLSSVQGKLTGYGSLDSVLVQAASADVTTAAEWQITSILDRRHGVTSSDTRDYQVLNSASLVAAVQDTIGIFTVLLGAVAAISLLVGGIGITNIMLVTVTERTREIGIRKAVGARRSAIVSQFLIESMVLSVIGGGFGVLVAVCVSQFPIAGVTPVIVPASVVGALVVSVAIGLFFGSYPANRAASLRPIEALRHE